MTSVETARHDGTVSDWLGCSAPKWIHQPSACFG
jgi:hypothetical protein